MTSFKMRKSDEINKLSEQIHEALAGLQEQATRADLPRDVVLTTALELVVRILAFQCGQPKLSQVLQGMASNPDGLHNIEPGWVAQKLGLV
jgi:hypothetical protein